METKVFCIYILLGILFDIIDLIYHYNECKEITLRDILLCPFFIIIWPIPTFLLLKEQFNTISIRLKEAKDYVDSCIGEYNMFPKVITKEEVNEIIKKLKPYNVGINIIKLMQQKYCTYTVRISINFVGLISQERI